MDDVMTTSEASQRLGISPERTRTLWRDGVLSGRVIANRLLLDRSSVLGVAEGHRPTTRPLSPRNAWSLLLLLAGERSPWISPPESSRLRAALFTRQESELAALTRSRARTLRFGGVAGAGEYVRQWRGCVMGGVTVAHRWTDLVGTDATEVYQPGSAVDDMMRKLRLWREPEGSIVVHVVPPDLASVLAGRTEMPPPAVAADLLESTDSRSRAAGRALWGRTVGEWRESAPPLRRRANS